MKKVFVWIAASVALAFAGWRYWSAQHSGSAGMSPPTAGWKKLEADRSAVPGTPSSLDRVLSGSEDPLLTVGRQELDRKRKSQSDRPPKVDHVAVVSPAYAQESLPRRVAVAATAEAELSFCVIQDDNGTLQVVYRSERIGRSLPVPRLGTQGRQMLVVYLFPLTSRGDEFLQRAGAEELVLVEQDD
jgi:hypothetical protein